MLTDNRYSSYSDVHTYLVFHGASDGKKSACNAGDLDFIPGSGRFPGEENGYLIQYSCPQNSMGRGAWWATVHGVTCLPLCIHTNVANIFSINV